ncbi:MAG: hypothetical protein ACRD12_06325 [Acidimicrobiales bacterium]
MVLVVAVVVDYWALRVVSDDLPPLPGRQPGVRLLAAAEARRARLRGEVGTVLVAASYGIVACLHELAVTLVAARRGPTAWRGAVGFLRERRALGFAVEAGRAGRRYARQRSPDMENQRRALALLLVGGAAVLVAVAFLQVEPIVDHSAFLANLFDDLGRWWNGLSWWQQTLVIVGLAALLTFGGMGFLPALNLVAAASSAAAYGQGIGTFLRNPRQATTDYVRNLTPAEVATQLAGAAVSRLLPGAAGGLAGRRVRRELLSQAEQAAIGRSRHALQRATDGAAEINDGRNGRSLKAAASDGERTLSGWQQPRPAGFAEANPEEVLELSREIGHELQPSGGLDQVRRGGFVGKHKASHAEKQLAIRRPNDPIAVSEPMCPDCQGFFQRLAIHRNRTQVVTDPDGTYIFRADGTVDFVEEAP